MTQSDCLGCPPAHVRGYSPSAFHVANEFSGLGWRKRNAYWLSPYSQATETFKARAIAVAS